MQSRRDAVASVPILSLELRRDNPFQDACVHALQNSNRTSLSVSQLYMFESQSVAIHSLALSTSHFTHHQSQESHWLQSKTGPEVLIYNTPDVSVNHPNTCTVRACTLLTARPRPGPNYLQPHLCLESQIKANLVFPHKSKVLIQLPTL